MGKVELRAESLFKDGSKKCIILSNRCNRDIQCHYASDRCTACAFTMILEDEVKDVLDKISG